MWPFWSSESQNLGKNWLQSYTTRWIWCERSKLEATNKLNKTNNNHLKAKRRTPRSTTPRIYLWDGTVSQFHIGCTSCTVWVLNTNVKYVETTVIGVGGRSRCTSRSGGTPTVWSVSRFQTPSTSRTSPPSATLSPFMKNWCGSPRSPSSGLRSRRSLRTTTVTSSIRRPTWTWRSRGWSNDSFLI